MFTFKSSLLFYVIFIYKPKMSNIFNNSDNFYSRGLDRRSDDDINLLQELCEESEDFFVTITDNPPAKDEAKNYLEALPPDKSYDDKFALGVFDKDDNRLIGFLDIIKDYRENSRWCLATLIISPRYRGKGIGSRVLSNLENFVIRQGGNTIILVVQEQNKKGYNFWQLKGFKKYDERLQDDNECKEFLMKKEL